MILDYLASLLETIDTISKSDACQELFLYICLIQRYFIYENRINHYLIVKNVERRQKSNIIIVYNN